MTLKHRYISMTRILIIINIICFILTLGGNAFINILGNNWHYSIARLQIYQFITSIFLHGGLMHLFCNMFSLVGMGSYIESSYGKKKFLIIYLISGVGAGIGSAVFNMILNRNIVSIGASGAICGLIGVLIANFQGNGKDRIKNILVTVAPLFILIFFGGKGIDNIAHISGLIVGYICGKIIIK